MKLINCLFLFFLFIEIWYGVAFARDIRLNYSNTRLQGMGGAYTAVADDYLAMFMNPAGLALQEKTSYNFLAPQAEFSTDFFSFMSHFRQLFMKINDLTSYIPKNDRHYYFGARNIWYYMQPNWGFSFYQNAEFDALKHSSNENLDLFSNIDFALSGTFAVPIPLPWWEGEKFYVGATPRMLYRFRYEKIITKAERDANPDRQIGFNEGFEGATITGDIGLLYNWNYVTDWPMSFGLTITDIAGSGFMFPMRVFTLDLPPKLQRDIGFGFSTKRKGLIWNSALRLSLDIRNTLKQAPGFLASLFIGAEWELPYFLVVRAGINQGWPSFGIGLNFWLIQVRGAFYWAEAGTTKREGDMRGMIELEVNDESVK